MTGLDVFLLTVVVTAMHLMWQVPRPDYSRPHSREEDRPCLFTELALCLMCSVLSRLFTMFLLFLNLRRSSSSRCSARVPATDTRASGPVDTLSEPYML